MLASREMTVTPRWVTSEMSDPGMSDPGISDLKDEWPRDKRPPRWVTPGKNDPRISDLSDEWPPRRVTLGMNDPGMSDLRNEWPQDKRPPEWVNPGISDPRINDPRDEWHSLTNSVVVQLQSECSSVNGLLIECVQYHAFDFQDLDHSNNSHDNYTGLNHQHSQNYNGNCCLTSMGTFSSHCFKNVNYLRLSLEV